MNSEQKTAKQQDNQMKEMTRLFGLAIESLSVAAEGQDPRLDQSISELRDHMSKGTPSPVMLNQLSSHARSMSAIRRSRVEKQLQGFSDCIAQLLMLDPPLEMKKKLAEFVRSTRKSIAKPEVQELLPIKYAKLQKQVLRESAISDSDIEVTDSEVMEIEALFEDDSLDGLPAFSTVAETIETLLMDLVVEIHPPEAVRPALDKARQILSAGLNWYELAAFLEQLSIVVKASLVGDQQEFELFLQALNEQLLSVSGGVDGIDGITRALFNGGDNLDEKLRHDMESFAGNIESEESVGGLKKSVKSHLETVFEQLNESRDERVAQQASYENEIQSLHSQVKELEEETAKAKKEIEVQQQRTQRDGLTDLPNRLAYNRRLDIEFGRWERYQRKFCLVVADVDHFKLINDSYGHLAGDKVLCVLAKTLRKRLRRTDFISRFGGEEFALILSETDAEEGLKAMEHICKMVRECPFHFNNEPLKITVSFGIAQVMEGDDAESLFTRADKAMYEAKTGGRDRCVLAENVA